MSRLDDKCLDSVCDRAVERLFEVVDLIAVTGIHVIDDYLTGKTAADAPFGKSLFDSFLDSTDRQAAAVVVAGTEADDQKFCFTYAVFIAELVKRCVACFIVFLVFLFRSRLRCRLRISLFGWCFVRRLIIAAVSACSDKREDHYD